MYKIPRPNKHSPVALLSPAYVPEAKCDISDETCLRGTRTLPSQTPPQLFSSSDGEQTHPRALPLSIPESLGV